MVKLILVVGILVGLVVYALLNPPPMPDYGSCLRSHTVTRTVERWYGKFFFPKNETVRVCDVYQYPKGDGPNAVRG